MRKVRIIARIDINNDSAVKGKCLGGLRKIGKPNELTRKYYNRKVL